MTASDSRTETLQHRVAALEEQLTWWCIIAQGRGTEKGLFKTKLCDHWQSGRICPKGTSCSFAHGPGEIRPFPGSQLVRLTVSAVHCT